MWAVSGRRKSQNPYPEALAASRDAGRIPDAGAPSPLGTINAYIPVKAEVQRMFVEKIILVSMVVGVCLVLSRLADVVMKAKHAD